MRGVVVALNCFPVFQTFICSEFISIIKYYGNWWLMPTWHSVHYAKEVMRASIKYLGKNCNCNLIAIISLHYSATQINHLNLNSFTLIQFTTHTTRLQPSLIKKETKNIFLVVENIHSKSWKIFCAPLTLL